MCMRATDSDGETALHRQFDYAIGHLQVSGGILFSDIVRIQWLSMKCSNRDSFDWIFNCHLLHVRRILHADVVYLGVSVRNDGWHNNEQYVTGRKFSDYWMRKREKWARTRALCINNSFRCFVVIANIRCDIFQCLTLQALLPLFTLLNMTLLLFGVRNVLSGAVVEVPMIFVRHSVVSQLYNPDWFRAWFYPHSLARLSWLRISNITGGEGTLKCKHENCFSERFSTCSAKFFPVNKIL